MAQNKKDKQDRQDKTMEEQLSETIINSSTLYNGRIFDVERVDVLLANGRPAVRDIVRHTGAVGIIALDDNGKMLMVHQFRTSLERLTIEIPAGRLEPGEEPLECAKRELSEETGYAAQTWEYLGAIASAAGYSDELVHIVLARDFTPGKAHPDEGEFVASDWVEVKELVNDVLAGKIEDSKTMVAALMAEVQINRGRW